MYHLYADDTIVYCCSTSLTQALEFLQVAFSVIQSRLDDLKLVLNTDKTKLMVFSHAKVLPQNITNILTTKGKSIERVLNYKYLGFTLDQELSFKAHINKLVTKLRAKLGFFFRNRTCFSLRVRKKIVTATFLPILDYGDVLYLNVSSKCLKSLDTVFHTALRFVTGCSRLTHHCELYLKSNLPSLSARRYAHWLTLIYKALLGLIPSYLCVLLQKTSSCYALRSCSTLVLSVPRVRTEFGKRAFSFAAPLAWNTLQTELKLSKLISLGAFRSILKDRQRKLIEQCLCLKS